MSQLIAVVVAHPDDETLWMGSQLSQIGRWKLIHLTDGAPRNSKDALRAGYRNWQRYAVARRLELLDALQVIGGRPQEHISYNIADQEGVHHLVPATERLCVDLIGVGTVFTHAYEHGHPDHDSAAFAVRAACSLITRAGQRAPVIMEFASYHVRDGRPVSGEFFPAVGFPESVVQMTASSCARKSRALQCFVTQQPSLQQFFPYNERLRAAPTYDFSRPAPPRDALYDSFDWGIKSSSWRDIAYRSMRRLGCMSAL